MLRIPRYPKATAMAIGAVASIAGLCWITPPYKVLVRKALGSDRVLLDRDGKVLQTLRTDYRKRRLPWQPLSSFPGALTRAVTEAEDQRFYRHPGIDPIGIGRAFWAMLRSRQLQGASTITMQLADLIQDDVLLRDKPIKKGSLIHKVAQATRALGLELKWSKAEILEAYLNLIHLRGEFQGVPAVSYAYLKKAPSALDPSESIAIASMISSPNQALAAWKERACALDRRMSGEGCARAHSAVQAFLSGSPSLPAQVGSALQLARRLVRANPKEPVILSTVDGELQTAVESILEKNVGRLENSNVHDSAAIVIENRTGHVLAYVGSVSASDSPDVDGTEAYRQAGSSLKPFFYAKAIDQKLITPASILLDDPTAISWGKDVYRPANYDKHFHGPVSVREALGSSINVPAVKTVMVLGLRQAYDALKSIHLTNLNTPDFYGVSMALGAVEVRLDDLANAYRIFANGGYWSPLAFTKGQSVKSERVFGPEASFMISSILSDPNARSIGFGWDSPLETPFWTAVKTGTSKDYHDNWCVGFSELYTVAVWTGNFDARAMDKVSGVSGAGPSWYEIMGRLHRSVRSDPPAVPAGVVEKKIRFSWSGREQSEYFIKGTEPVGQWVEPVLQKRIQFYFPAEGSVLVKDPHLDPSRLALFVRFKGSVSKSSRLWLDGKDIGEAVSPFKITAIAPGEHELAIRSPDGESPSIVHFQVRGAW